MKWAEAFRNSAFVLNIPHEFESDSTLAQESVAAFNPQATIQKRCTSKVAATTPASTGVGEDASSTAHTGCPPHTVLLLESEARLPICPTGVTTKTLGLGSGGKRPTLREGLVKFRQPSCWQIRSAWEGRWIPFRVQQQVYREEWVGCGLEEFQQA